MKHPDLLRELGPVREVAAAFKVAGEDIAHWRRRGIPARRWPDAVRIAAERGILITIEELAAAWPPGVKVAAE